MSARHSDASICPEDMSLPEVLMDVVDLAFPCRIYGEAFKGEERPEVDISCLISAMIDAAIWGAENHEWVLAFKERKQAIADADSEMDDYDGEIH